MPERRDARDVGSDSPTSEEAKEQVRSGARGAPRGDQEQGTPDQPPQGSNRGPGAQHQEKPEVRRRFAEGRAPSEQGDPDPGDAARVRESDALQGIQPHGGGRSED